VWKSGKREKKNKYEDQRFKGLTRRLNKERISGREPPNSLKFLLGAKKKKRNKNKTVGRNKDSQANIRQSCGANGKEKKA